MNEIVKHINDTNASYRQLSAGDAKNTDLFLDNEHYALFKDSGEQITVRFNKENLSKAILFIASILPRKFDQSSIHCTIPYSKDFVTDQLALLDALFKENGIPVETTTQIWNARKDVLQKNGKVDSRFYFNGLIKDVAFTDHSGMLCNSKFTIRNYLAGGYSDLHVKRADDGVFDIIVTNVTTPYDDGKEKGLEDTKIITPDISFNKIFYGAPGTGKSHTVEDDYVKGHKSFRITFHPDTDYASFVGCYKPSMGGPDEDQITYAFVPQVFLKAYEYAWNHPGEKTFLVIEELNRGNCAQIFGDVFQLLDRRVNDHPGFSKYKINADTDIAGYLKKHIANEDGAYEKKIIEIYGLSEFDFSIMAIPDNLYIIATMNTSDQSLFPIDSAFKRRWEWEYVRVNYDDAAQFSLKIDDKHKYNWDKVLRGLNDYIKSETHNTNKILGNRFVQAGANGVISARAFRDKVLFFLFNDVFKDDDDFKADFFGENAEDKFFEDLCITDDTKLTIRFIEGKCGAVNIATTNAQETETSEPSAE
ncbi:MAG: AAA family ATPase [Bacteroidia bacterium]|nr:AAA family ATPase [Bacteroidia bacterium]